jgi:hypothetical protein
MLETLEEMAGRFDQSNLPDAGKRDAAPDRVTRLLKRGKRIAALAKRFGWGEAELAAVDRIIEAVEGGDFAGPYIHAQRLMEKVDGTAKAHDPICGAMDRARALAVWWIARRSAWRAAGEPEFGLTLVLVCGMDIKAAEATAGRSRTGYLALAIDRMIKQVAKREA